MIIKNKFSLRIIHVQSINYFNYNCVMSIIILIIHVQSVDIFKLVWSGFVIIQMY